MSQSVWDVETISPLKYLPFHVIQLFFRVIRISLGMCSIFSRTLAFPNSRLGSFWFLVLLWKYRHFCQQFYKYIIVLITASWHLFHRSLPEKVYRNCSPKTRKIKSKNCVREINQELHKINNSSYAAQTIVATLQQYCYYIATILQQHCNIADSKQYKKILVGRI